MLHEAANELLQQLEFLITQSKHEDFFRSLPELGGSSIGQHVRHSIDFFECVLAGVEDRMICYDNRSRDPMLESDRAVAIGKLRQVRERLDFRKEDVSLVVKANFSAQKDASVDIQSSYFRELAYAIEHMIHHMALISVAVRVSLQYIELPEYFAVASSTVRFRKEQLAG